MSKADKTRLRKTCMQMRGQLRSAEKDSRIAERVLAHIKVKEADTVLLYASFGTETDTRQIADALWESDIPVAFPRCGKNREMTFHLVRSREMLLRGSYGIPEPPESLPCPEITEKTLCIVPGLAFTEKGGRLGYGGGYYDSFIQKYPYIYTIAIAYDGLVLDSLPLEEHDIPMNEIVTEERTVLCRE